MTNRAAENLALLDVETGRLLTTCRGLVAAGAGAAARPTLCEGWDAARLLTHLARNADALGNLVRWAGDGVERQAYASVAQRDRDIETGARRPLAEIAADVEVTASRFRELAGTLTGPAGEAQVRTRTGTPVQGHQVVAMRVLEVVFHHVDLQAGYTFDDADPACRRAHAPPRRGPVGRDRRGAGAHPHAGRPGGGGDRHLRYAAAPALRRRHRGLGDPGAAAALAGARPHGRVVDRRRPPDPAALGLRPVPTRSRDTTVAVATGVARLRSV
ncbi:maleylpyruvate isomerase N-terminal domain-containing protein [Ornithinimicrobium sp. W1665]|uniref:maleylpyruvate isomerase N-terminal domain-containing protein n=1 Tax=Ornithinimicrobium sp. W1665 TaxID=3416666 RepID=UPI003D6B2658